MEQNSYLNYKNKIEDMKDNKIDDMIDFENKNEKLNELLDSGFLDRSKSLEHVLSVMKETKESNDNIYSLEGLNVSEGESTSLEFVKNEVNLLVESSQDEVLLTMMVDKSEQLDSTDISYSSDATKLYKFFQDFVKIDPILQESIEKSVEKVHEIRQYEEDLFLNRMDATLAGRGTPTFCKMTTQE